MTKHSISHGPKKVSVISERDKSFPEFNYRNKLMIRKLGKNRSLKKLYEKIVD